jgi:hypothetical protein
MPNQVVAANTAVEITKAVVPLATFAAGYLLSSWDKFRESRRRLGNTRAILTKELDENAEALNKLWPPSNDLAEAVPFGALIAEACAGLSTQVYDGYLDRLDALGTAELDRVYDAYDGVRRAIEAGRAYQQARQQRFPEGPSDFVAAALFTADAALERMLAALEALPPGAPVRTRLLEQRGSERARAAEMQAAISSARESQDDSSSREPHSPQAPES